MQQRHKQAPGLSHWLGQLLGRTHQNVVVVALANKLVRMARAVLCKNRRAICGHEGRASQFSGNPLEIREELMKGLSHQAPR